MKDKNVKIVSLILIAFQAIFLFISYFYLPDTLVMQINLEGEAGTTLPTLIGLPLFFLLVVVVNLRFFSTKDQNVGIKAILINLFFILIEVIMVTWNL